MGRSGEFIFPHIRLAGISLIMHILNKHWPASQALRVKPPAVKKMGKKWVEGKQNLQRTFSRCMQVYGILNSIYVCLVCYYEFDFSRAGKYCAKSWIRAHTDVQKKKLKVKCVQCWGHTVVQAWAKTWTLFLEGFLFLVHKINHLHFLLEQHAGRK